MTEPGETPVVPLPSAEEPLFPKLLHKLQHKWRSVPVARRIPLGVVGPLATFGVFAGSVVASRVGGIVAFDIFFGSVGTSSHPGAGNWGVVLAAIGFLMVPAVASLVLGEIIFRLTRPEE